MRTAVLLIVSSLTASLAASPTVLFGSATLVGTATSIPSASASANAFVGLPFAKPPKRFHAPEPLDNFTGTYDATAYKPACIQQGSPSNVWNDKLPFDFAEAYNGSQSEDCLYLNIYTPLNATCTSHLPVQFFIYGGNLQTGSGDKLLYDASALAARQNIVSVVINYRVSVFGFAPSDELALTQRNLGFLDQRLALTWVHENIRDFGGDNSKIAIQGQSAGAYSVKNLWALPPNPLPFRAAIMESQATLLPSNDWDKLVGLLNCTRAISKLACVQAADAMTISSLATRNLLSFPPTVDYITHLDHIEVAIAAKTAAPVPLLIGTNGNELGQVLHFLQSSNASSDTPAAVKGLTANDIISFLFPNPTDATYFRQLVAQDLKNASNDSEEAATHALNQYLFTCRTRAISQLAAQNGYSVWRYLYNATVDSISTTPGSEARGASHTSEVPVLFGTYPPNATDLAKLEQLSTFVGGLWADFIRDPTGGLAWPKYDSVYESLFLIGNDGVVNGSFIVPGVVDYDCALYDPLIIGRGKL